MKRKINILYIIDFFHHTGGTEKHLALLLQHLSSERFNSVVVAFDLGTNVLIDSIRAEGVTVIHLPVGHIYNSHAMAQAFELRRIIKKHRIDIVQTFHQKADTFGAMVAKLSGVKRLISSKRDTAELKSASYLILGRALRFLFDKVIVVADAVGEAVVMREGIARSKLVRIYNGVDAQKFRPPTGNEIFHERKKLGLTKDDFVVGMVAGFRPEKGHRFFFEGAIKAMREIPSMKLLAVGKGPLLDQYRNYCANEGIGDRVIFPGATDEVAVVLRTMDIGCLTPTGNEGFSNAVIEKMATGLPIIVTNIGGNSEAIIDQQNGIVIEPANSTAIYASILALYKDPEKRRSMGQRSRQLVEQSFTIEQMCLNHEALYVSLCS